MLSWWKTEDVREDRPVELWLNALLTKKSKLRGSSCVTTYFRSAQPMQSLISVYNCLKEYLDSISPFLHDGVVDIISSLHKRYTQSEVNRDLFWLLTSKGWSYDSLPAKLDQIPPSDLPSSLLTL